MVSACQILQQDFSFLYNLTDSVIAELMYVLSCIDLVLLVVTE